MLLLEAFLYEFQNMEINYLRNNKYLEYLTTTNI